MIGKGAVRSLRMSFRTQTMLNVLGMVGSSFHLFTCLQKMQNHNWKVDGKGRGTHL